MMDWGPSYYGRQQWVDTMDGSTIAAPAIPMTVDSFMEALIDARDLYADRRHGRNRTWVETVFPMSQEDRLLTSVELLAVEKATMRDVLQAQDAKTTAWWAAKLREAELSSMSWLNPRAVVREMFRESGAQ